MKTLQFIIFYVQTRKVVKDMTKITQNRYGNKTEKLLIITVCNFA